MTEISFYFNVPSRMEYACRIARKAQRQGSALAVAAEEGALAEFDRQLWRFAAVEFVPHAWAERSGDVPARLHASTVWLSADAPASPVHEALLNLGDDVPAGFETFARLYEIVSTDEAERAAARGRWKRYADRGYAIRRHEAGGAS